MTETRACATCRHYAKSHAFLMHTIVTRHYCCCEPTAMSQYNQFRKDASLLITPSWTTTLHDEGNPVEYFHCPRWAPTWELP